MAAASDELEVRRRRLAYRACHRGIKEMDLIFSAFVSERMNGLSADKLDLLERLLDEPDQDLFSWISGAVPVPDAHDNEIMAALKRRRFTTGDYGGDA